MVFCDDFYPRSYQKLYQKYDYKQIFIQIYRKLIVFFEKYINFIAAMRQNGEFFMKAVITVTGKDSVGIIAKVSAECAKYDANIVDISQSVLSEYFAMIMLADIDGLKVSFSEFVDIMSELGRERALSINVMHEDIFNTMHHI